MPPLRGCAASSQAAGVVRTPRQSGIYSAQLWGNIDEEEDGGLARRVCELAGWLVGWLAWLVCNYDPFRLPFIAPK